MGKGTGLGLSTVYRLEADLVILDLNMPGLGGAGTLPLFRALRPDLPVLLATGRLDQAASDLARAHARVHLLAKPFSREDLQQNLERLGFGHLRPVG